MGDNDTILRRRGCSGCGGPIRSNNRYGYCYRCRNGEIGRTECRHEGCEQTVLATNPSGLCAGCSGRDAAAGGNAPTPEEIQARARIERQRHYAQRRGEPYTPSELITDMEA